MAQWDPLRDLMVLQDRMNQLFEDATHRRARQPEPADDNLERSDWTPAADVYEHSEEYLVAIDLPGVDREALEIDLDEKSLSVKGHRMTTNGETSPRRSERRQGRFVRSFDLPTGVDHKKIGAEYKDGVLYLHLPRIKEQHTPVKIKIS